MVGRLTLVFFNEREGGGGERNGELGRVVKGGKGKEKERGDREAKGIAF